MALRVTPGPIPKDGVAFDSVEEQLKAFVNQTEILNIGIENFTRDGTPFVVSASEPPTFRTPGQLWYKRGEGRLYCWFDKGASAASFANTVNDEGITLAYGAFRMIPGHWIAVSDRKEIYAIYAAAGQDNRTNPYFPVRLEGGVGPASAETFDAVWDYLSAHDVDHQTTTGLWHDGSQTSVAFVGPRLGTWGARIFSNKLFVHTTNVTLPPSTQYGGVFHELGYRRVASQSLTGPIYGAVAGSPNTLDHDLTAFRKSLHWPPTNVTNPYYADYSTQTAFVGYVTESGPAKETLRRHLTFWFANCPTNNFQPE